MGIGSLKGTITRQAQARTYHLYAYRFFADRDGSTHSVELPSTKYSVGGSSGEGSWALLDSLFPRLLFLRESREGPGECSEDEDEEADEQED